MGPARSVVQAETALTLLGARLEGIAPGHPYRAKKPARPLRGPRLTAGVLLAGLAVVVYVEIRRIARLCRDRPVDSRADDAPQAASGPAPLRAPLGRPPPPFPGTDLPRELIRAPKLCALAGAGALSRTGAGAWPLRSGAPKARLVHSPPHRVSWEGKAPGLVLGHADYHFRHEPLLYGYKPGAGRRGRGGEGWYGDDAQQSVLEVPRPRAAREHPTMKPVELVEIALSNSSRRREVVLDPFAGSGSTMVAAERLGRRASLVELDPAYCDVICDRFERLTGRAAELVERADG